MATPDRRRRAARPAAAVLMASAVVVGPWLAPRIGLGQAPGARAASADDLLKAAPFDRITLADGTTLTVEPLSPRPLPPYDPTKDKEEKPEPPPTRKGKRPPPPPEGNVFLPGHEPRAREKDDEPINELTIHTVGGDGGDFKIKRANIKSIEYFEDILISEGKRLVLLKDFARAFEHYLRVKLRNPDWKGLREAVDDLLFEEGSAALLLDNDHEKALRLLNELRERRPDYPELADRLAGAYAGRLKEAFGKGAYRQARRVLHELGRVAPGHALGREWRERMTAQARGLAARAEKKAGADRLDGLAEALRIWPDLDDVAAKYREAFAALPTLDVAVIDLPRPFGPWVRSPADERATRLTYLPTLRDDDPEAARKPRPGQLAESLERADIGRRLILRVREGVQWSDGSRPVAAADVVRTLEDMARPDSPSYRARWEGLLERIEATDARQVEIRLTRPPLRPEAWLLGPVAPAHAGPDGLVTTAEGRRVRIGDGPFVPEKAGDDAFTYMAAGGESSAGGPRIRRLREVRMSDPALALGALLRGEVSLVERIPPDRVSALSAAPDIKVGRYERPSLHWIAVDGRNPLLRNRNLRRALSDAIDRKGLLEETLLRRPIDANNTPADGPFLKGSYADVPDVKPLEYDPVLARALVRVAQTAMNSGPIKLTFEYPATPEAKAVAPKIAEAWRAAGLEIQEVERPESELETALRAGRRFDLAYRSSRTGEPVVDAGPRLCPGYDAPPSAEGLSAIASTRILQLLIDGLERAPEWPSARGVVTQIDRECRDELPIVPLWQIEDHYAWRSRLKGPADSADHLYETIGSWEIEPWIAKEPW